MTTSPVPMSFRPSAAVAAEIRAEMGRQGMTQTRLAQRLHVSQHWLSTRISPTARVDMTVDEIVHMAEALGVSAEGLLAPLLPRLDSNQQPSGYPLVQVNEAEVVDLAAARARRSAA